MSVLALIAEAAGEDAAERIAAEFGGCRLYIPVRIRPGHRLCTLVGEQAALAIIRTVGHGHVDVPHGRRPPWETRQKVAELTRAGLSASGIARRLGITARTVIRHRAALRAAGALPPASTPVWVVPHFEISRR